FTDDAGNDFELGSYTDRGDPATNDYTVGDFTTDSTWRDLNLGPTGAGIVPAGAKAVLLRVAVKDDAAGSQIKFRKNGHTNEINSGGSLVVVVNVTNIEETTVACDTNQVVEYWATNTVFTVINVTVKAWYT
ncbi:hypothetical protein LCGC14_2711890, partial [marine sediment metagenome]